MPGVAANAQVNKEAKHILKAATSTPFSIQLERQMADLKYSPDQQGASFLIINPRPIVPLQAPDLSSQSIVLKDKGVSLTDGKTKPTGQHSIAPSAVTVLGSSAIRRAEDRAIDFLRRREMAGNNQEYLSPFERTRWKADFEALRVLWNKAAPSDPNRLEPFLTHQVPDKTYLYLKQEYANLVTLIEQTQKFLMPKIAYSFLQNEGRRFSREERVHINKAIYQVRSQIAILLKAINKNPYLLVQQKYWDRMFGTFNPLLKGVLSKPTSIFRQDERTFVLSEFALHNPDGSSPYLPNSNSMIAGESQTEDDEDDFDEEQYAGTPQVLQRQAARRAAEREHNQQMLQLAEQERDALLQHIPAGLRIAVINDDLLPLLNFKGWAKNGYLGKNATVSTFRDGFSFMQQIRNGKRYDIIITDLVVPDGGVSMMENFRLLDSKAIVFASSKFYPGDGDDFSAHDLFNFGMDGYIWNNTNLNEGAYGYLQYLRQVNNYYYYKNKYNWGR